MELKVVPDKAAAAEAAADLLVSHAKPGAHIGLAGGSTPEAAYKLAAQRHDDWNGVTMWFGDDRVVEPTDGRSNYLMVQRSLLDNLAPDGHPKIERVHGEHGMEVAANDYDQRLRAALEGRPGLDLVLLGLGPDSHTASLFPGKPALEESERLAVGVPEAGMEPHVPRVTLTFPALNAARKVVFLVCGADKAEAMKRAFGDPADPTSPAAHVRPDSDDLLVIADGAAAAGL